MIEVCNLNFHLPPELVTSLQSGTDLFFLLSGPSDRKPTDTKTGFLQLCCSTDVEFQVERQNSMPGGSFNQKTVSPLKRNAANSTLQQAPRKKPTQNSSLNVKKEAALIPSVSTGG